MNGHQVVDLSVAKNDTRMDNAQEVPMMPAATRAIHRAKGVHFDGAKNEPAIRPEGPATSTPFVPAKSDWRVISTSLASAP